MRTVQLSLMEAEGDKEGVWHPSSKASGKLTSSLYRLVRGVHAAKKNIDDFALHVSTFTDVVYASYSCLEKHYSNRTNLRVLRHVDRQNLLQKIAERGSRIRKDLREIRPRMKSLPSNGPQLVAKIKWHFRRPEVDSLKLQMTSFEQTLNTLISVINYELLEQQGGDPIRSNILLRQIENHTKAFGVLAAKIDGLVASHDTFSTAFLELSEMQEIIHTIAARKVESVHRQRRAIERSEVDARSEVPIQRSSQMSRHRPRSQRVRRPDPNQTPSSEPIPTPNQTLRTSIPTPERGTDEVEPTTTTDNALVSQSANPEHPQPLTDTIDEFTFFKLIVGKISREDDRLSIRNTMGQSVTAKLYENFGRNVMSQNLAVQHGLEIRPIIAKTERNLYFLEPTLPMTMVGHVYFVWRSGTLAFRVHCSVVEENNFPGAPLVLGRPFVESRDSARLARRGDS